MAVSDDTGTPEPAVPTPAPEGASLVRRLVPYASVAGAIFLLRIVVSVLRRRKT